MAAMLFNQYTFLLWWVALMAVFAQFANVYTAVDVLGRREPRVYFLFAVLVFFPVFRLAAFGPIIADTWAYVNSYEKLPGQFVDVINCLKNHESGFGYEAFERLLKWLIGGDRTVYRVTVALIHSVPIVLILRRYSEDYLLSVFLFIANGFHIAWMMNGLRQFVAIVIIFSALPLMVRKRYLASIIVILLSATIHTSALIMLPVLFVVQGKAWNWKTILSILAAVAGMYIFSVNVKLFDVLVQNTEYEGAVESWVALGDDGANPIRILISAVPVFIAFVGRKQLEEANDPVTNICVNMSAISMGLYMIAAVTSGIMVGRLPGYTNLYSLILYPSLIRRVFTRDSARIVTIATIGFYLAYYFYSMS